MNDSKVSMVKSWNGITLKCRNCASAAHVFDITCERKASDSGERVYWAGCSNVTCDCYVGCELVEVPEWAKVESQ